MRRSHLVRLALGLAAISTGALIFAPASIGQQQSAPPIARYTMDAGTVSGMAAMGQGMGSAMSMMFGGGGNKQIHELTLRLGSSRTPAGGAPKADHFMPPEAKLGKSVALLSPTPAAASTPEPTKPAPFERPKGRLLIYWGCGANAPRNQPVVIDFAKVAAGQIPPGLYAQAASFPPDWRVSPGNSKTYGDWPNAKDGKTIKSDASLLGAHKVVANYAPEIGFSLTQDFMPAITGSSSPLPNGAVQLSWNAINAATGYYAWLFSANPGADGKAVDMVWWASSATQAFGGPLWDWLSPSTVQKLIAQKVVMPPNQTSCTVPAEVKKAGGQIMMGSLYAYGPEANFAYPPRPADPKVMWKPEWTTRVRYRANTMWMIGGPDMGAMMNGAQAQDQQERPKPKKCKGGFGGLLAGATGIGC